MGVRQWADQPDFLERGTHKACFWFKDVGSAQVIKLNEYYYMTVGNLFGSQTVRVPNVDELFKLIELTNKVDNGSMKKPGKSYLEKHHPTWKLYDSSDLEAATS